jgi:hypothetical protein
MPLVWDGLYLQGVRALSALGDPDAVDCSLQPYVHDNACETATPRDLLAALSLTFPNAEAVLTGFGAHFHQGHVSGERVFTLSQPGSGVRLSAAGERAG